MFAQLQLEAWNYRAKIGVSAPLTVPVECALYLNRPQLNSHQGVGYTDTQIIVGMNSQWDGNLLLDSTPNLGEFRRKGSAIGVAKDQYRGAAVLGGEECLQRITRVSFVTVEKMFSIVNQFAAVTFHIGHGVLDELNVLVRCGSQYVRDVELPGFSKERYDFGTGIQKGIQDGIFFRRIVRPSSTPKSGNLGIRVGVFGCPYEELQVLRIRRIRPSTFDEVNTQVIESLRNAKLVINGEGYPFGLCAVAKCCIVDLYGIRHWYTPGYGSE